MAIGLDDKRDAPTIIYELLEYSYGQGRVIDSIITPMWDDVSHSLYLQTMLSRRQEYSRDSVPTSLYLDFMRYYSQEYRPRVDGILIDLEMVAGYENLDEGEIVYLGQGVHVEEWGELQVGEAAQPEDVQGQGEAAGTPEAASEDDDTRDNFSFIGHSVDYNTRGYESLDEHDERANYSYIDVHGRTHWAHLDARDYESLDEHDSRALFSYTDIGGGIHWTHTRAAAYLQWQLFREIVSSDED